MQRKMNRTKLAVINFSGNVGKSTVSKYLLFPRLEDCEITTIETINSNEFDDADSLKGKEFSSLLESMSIAENFIADIGASNVEVFIEQMIKFKNSHKSFDYFIVPVSPKLKQQTDTIATIKKLSSIGIPKDKILLVFNMVEDTALLEKTFSSIIEYHANNDSFILNLSAVITENEFYLLNKNSGKSIEDIVNDPRDFQRLISDSSDRSVKLGLAGEMATQMLAGSVKDELDYVFSILFPAQPIKQIGNEDRVIDVGFSDELA